MKYFGITETGDPCFVPDWDLRLREANIIISKELTDEMIEKLIQHKDRIIFHHTVTGLGGTVFEPNVKDWEYEYEQFKKLTEYRFKFPMEHYVLRIDPIIPYLDESFDAIRSILDAWSHYNISHLGKITMRCRISILDGYNHVKERFNKAGVPYLDEIKFTASNAEFEKVEKLLKPYKDHFIFESCAENKFSDEFIQPIGCASYKDIAILNLDPSDYIFTENKQRPLCHCLPKRQILGIKPGRCKHQCLYCFWKD